MVDLLMPMTGTTRIIKFLMFWIFKSLNFQILIINMLYDLWKIFSFRTMNLIGYNIGLTSLLYTCLGIFIFNYFIFIPEKV